jgi:hypothetical protein
MTIRADHSMAYMAAMMMMLACGVYAYFVEGLAMNDYYQAISVPIVFFTILVAFMMDRLIHSDKREETLAIEIINYIESQAKELEARAELYIGNVVAIVSTNDVAAVDRHYREVRNAGEDAMKGIYNRLDDLAMSKLQGTSFSEIFILLLLGVLIVATSMVFRPTDIVGDTFSIVLSLTVTFILFAVFDLQRRRKRFYLERGANGHRNLSGHAVGNRASEQILSTVLIVIVMAAFIGLLVTKRYPVPPG